MKDPRFENIEYDHYNRLVGRTYRRGQAAPVVVAPSVDPIAFLFAIVLGAAMALGVVSIFAVVAGCAADWNAPNPIVPEVGNPCGLDWHSCGNGKCCYDSDDCRPSGGCAFGGLLSPTWGATAPDAGATVQHSEYPQQTPETIRWRQGR